MRYTSGRNLSLLESETEQVLEFNLLQVVVNDVLSLFLSQYVTLCLKIEWFGAVLLQERV